ncbi:hypothetical protein [Effusibacillus dendaii]|uniref:Lipoprotein n=1 Tax=Effusibacillus dendaii TaxID=2743772 RepID=A0A7I8D6L5_9BACL|nr:hypothetical protein [Effusibacillus dendaii]BCJ85637.1 hypothetical protein skT53_06220 [Effusibacillus dendaii]
MAKISRSILGTLMFLSLTGCTNFSQPVSVNPNVSVQKEEPAIVVPEAVKQKLAEPGNAQRNDIRKFPYPYEAMLSIASDIDDTTVEEFKQYHRFLNTKETTPYGQGVGLDISDSMFMYMGNDQQVKVDKEGHGMNFVMTYFDGLNPNQIHNAAQIDYFFKAGWIDSLHGYGDFSRKNTHDISFNRSLVEKAWQALNQSGIHPKVLINHGDEANVGNFGGYSPNRVTKYQEGDVPKSPYYNADLTLKNGIHYIWNSIAESEFGHDSPIFEIKLRDGQKVWGFHRYTHELKGSQYNWNWSPRDLHLQLTNQHLDELIKKHQYSILAQHFGGYNLGFPLGEEDIKSLRELASYQEQGKILVARTSRLLDYSAAQQFVDYTVAHEEGKMWINIKSIKDPIFGVEEPSIEQVRGLTFYTDDPENTILLLNLTPIPSSEVQRNKADSSGKKSISIRWFAADYTDYTKNAP